jgi:hypothetical protein
MGRRIILGQLSGSVYGLKVSKKGQDANSATGKNLLFDSTNAGKSAIYFGKTISVGNNAVNNQIYTRSDFDGSAGYITHSGTKLQYNPLVVVLEDATGQDLNHSATTFTAGSSGVYSSNSAYISRLGLPTGSSFNEFIKETGTMYRTSAFYALSGSEGDSITSTNNSYSMDNATGVNTKATVRSYCFTSNSGDHPASDAILFNPNNSANQEFNTFGTSGDVYKSTVTDSQSNDFGKNKRLEFRKQTGEALNDKFFFRDNGSFYTVAKANLGGLPITNAKIAISKVPLGYGFMTSTFMGF